MKNYSNYIPLLFLGLLITIPSCNYDKYVRPTIQNISTPISFANSVLPVFNNNCAKSGCHNTGGISPDLSAANVYTNLFLYNLVDIDTTEPGNKPIDPSKSSVFLRLTSTDGSYRMPPTGALPQAYIDTVAAWIKQGGQNN